MGVTYVIMKTMHIRYCQNDFVATHALERVMYRYILLIPMNERVMNKLSQEDSQLVKLGTFWFSGTSNL